jgi:hypothetical protein
MAKNEFDMRNYDWTKAQRGKYLRRAQRSLGTLTIEKSVVDILGGPEKAATILRSIAAVITTKTKPKRPKAA